MRARRPSSRRRTRRPSRRRAPAPSSSDRRAQEGSRRPGRAPRGGRPPLPPRLHRARARRPPRAPRRLEGHRGRGRGRPGRPQLRARGVATALVDAALATLEGEDQLAQARALARRRLPALRRANPERAATRLRDQLLRRGFAAGIVARVVRESAGAGE
ncbi:MAG: hypothetical protein DME15_05065 [Candidatus Rokuibacteriota bacterium]|nr:MAG: hypothetical protein DME15_05065 [Candidatus Rokubacteria bacterium]